MKRASSFLLLVLACLAPSTAGAAVTLGPEDPNPLSIPAQTINWSSGALLFTASAPPGVQLTAPTDGVITSWLVYTDDVGLGAAVQLRVLTPAGSKSYAVGAAGPVEPIAPITPSDAQYRNVPHAFAAQVPIAAGQIVGVSFTRAAGSFVLPVLPAQSDMGWEYGCLAPGCASEVPTGPTPVPATQIKDQWLAMNAKMEPDVDRDGLGDETQDPCVGACQPSQPVTTPSTQQKKKCGKGKKLKRGKCVKKHKKHRKKRHKKSPRS